MGSFNEGPYTWFRLGLRSSAVPLPRALRLVLVLFIGVPPSSLVEVGEASFKDTVEFAPSSSSSSSGRARFPLFLNRLSKFFFHKENDLVVMSSSLSFPSSPFLDSKTRSKNEPSLVNTLVGFGFVLVV